MSSPLRTAFYLSGIALLSVSPCQAAKPTSPKAGASGSPSLVEMPSESDNSGEPAVDPSPVPGKVKTNLTPKIAEDKAKSEPTAWDAWYTVSVGAKKFHYGHYNDKVEYLKNHRVIFRNHFWKHEEGFINEEQIGSAAEDNLELTPLFFNYHSTYRGTELTIDGTLLPGSEIITVRIRKGDQEAPLVKKSLPPKAFFSQLFPLWLGRHLPSMKPGRTDSYRTLMEDNLEANYLTVSGTVRLENADEFARKTGTSRLSVELDHKKSTWYVEKAGQKIGMPVRIELPENKTVVEKVTQKEAETFFGK